MKIILALCVLTLVIGGLIIRNAMNPAFRFGEFTGAPTVTVRDLIEKPEQFRNQTVAVQGEVRQQCQAMGCHFFFVVEGKPPLRIDLEKLTGTAPMKEGHQARVEGRMAPFADGYQLEASAVEIK